MLTRSQYRSGTFQHLKVLNFSYLLRGASHRGERIYEPSVRFLIAVMLVCGRTNEFAKLCDVLSLMGRVVEGSNLDARVTPLLRAGLLERPVFGHYIVTNEGEYFLRDLETMFSRITKGSVRSKWKKIVPGDKREAFVRTSRIESAKIVATPADARLQIKHGLPALKKSGQPRKGYTPPPGPTA